MLSEAPARVLPPDFAFVKVKGGENDLGIPGKGGRGGGGRGGEGSNRILIAKQVQYIHMWGP